MKDLQRAAHFVQNRDIIGSPPNAAIVAALTEMGLCVDIFAPGASQADSVYGDTVRIFDVQYSRSWLLRALPSSRWRGYMHYSASAEDALVVAGVLAKWSRRPFCASVDEIKSGTYRGNAPEVWKRMARWAIRSAYHAVVNDQSRVALLRDYAHRNGQIGVYPGCFHQVPAPADRDSLRAAWGVPSGAAVIGVSGGFNETGGADWILDTVHADAGLFLVLQTVNASEFEKILLERVTCRKGMYIEPTRLSWQEAWASAAAFDMGVAIYHNPAPQFQNMGISSNRLCMFLAMGVPVIASRQPSFEFLERYDCGRMVGSAKEFAAAAAEIAGRREIMRTNALRCAVEYIQAPQRYRELYQTLSQSVAI